MSPRFHAERRVRLEVGCRPWAAQLKLPCPKGGITVTGRPFDDLLCILLDGCASHIEGLPRPQSNKEDS